MFAPVPVRALDVLSPVVPQVAARAQGRQIRRVVVSGVLIEVGASQDRFHQPPYRPMGGRVNAQRLSLIVVAFTGFRVQPAAASNHQHDLPMRTAAPLTSTPGPLKLDVIRQRSPVGRVEMAKIGMDGHSISAPIKNLGL